MAVLCVRFIIGKKSVERGGGRGGYEIGRSAYPVLREALAAVKVKGEGTAVLGTKRAHSSGLTTPARPHRKKYQLSLKPQPNTQHPKKNKKRERELIKGRKN